ncbi:hypothetical protein BCV71DRAFT_264279 [Rhizopus microsporus]|uniref:Uncharacterized protein n=1 Tax=Rhizopus microsporus TaxID=58291 RepID=A0A1X0S148_RHIZD|nr:hypothetical protein BCV71DRAFT_264279 [Rhizopus microsporus]
MDRGSTRSIVLISGACSVSLDKKSSPEQVAKAIKNLQNQNYALKRKYNDAIGEASSSISITISTATATTNPTNIESIDFTVESITQYERSMTFVENYVETRKQKGFKQMDRADMLRNQYKNYIKLVNNW